MDVPETLYARSGDVNPILFAAAHPERTRALVTYGAWATRIRSEDYPWAPTLEDRRELWEEHTAR